MFLCNSGYKNLLSSAVQTMIGTTLFYYTIGDNNNSVTTLNRSVFLLSVTELWGSYSGANIEGSTLPSNGVLKTSYFNGEPSAQWTRTPDTSNQKWSFLIGVTGSPGSDSVLQQFGFRPCFTLTSTAYVDSNLALIETA